MRNSTYGLYILTRQHRDMVARREAARSTRGDSRSDRKRARAEKIEQRGPKRGAREQ